MGKLACVGALASTIFLAACATPQLHPYEIEPTQVGAPGVETVALLPLNVWVALPPELDATTFRVTAAVRDHLSDCGREVTHFSMGDARGLWSHVSGGEGADTAVADDAVGRFVRSLHQAREFDVLVVPDLVYREAPIRIASQVAVWDGVERDLTVKGSAHSAGIFHGDAKIRGKAQGVSLHVAAYDPSGVRVFDGHGGLDLIHEWEFRTEYHYDRNMHRYAVPVYQQRFMKNRLADEAHLQEGIALAFHPYLVSPSHPVGEAR
ncbi:MAG: hypothetical protein ACQGVC_17545 [Myxococcota bacterium]